MSEGNQLTAFSGIPFSPAALAKPKREDKGYAPRLQLVSTGSSGLVEKGVSVGNYGLVDGDNVSDLGDSLTIIPLVRLDKAVDFSDSEEVVSAFGEDNPEFQRIKGEVDENGYDSGCMYGPLFLAFLVETCQFVELFLNNKSGRNVADDFNPFLPIGKEVAESLNVEPRAPQPVQLTSVLLPRKPSKKTRHKWHAIEVAAHEGPLNVAEPPSQEALQKACDNFVKQSIVEDEDRDR